MSTKVLSKIVMVGGLVVAGAQLAVGSIAGAVLGVAITTVFAVCEHLK